MTKMEPILNLVLQSVVVLIFGLLAYFTKRLIDDNDKQHKETSGSIKVLSRNVEEIQRSVSYLEIEYNELKAKGAFTPSKRKDSEERRDYTRDIEEFRGTLEKIKRKVSSSIIGVTKVQKDIGQILEKVESQDEEIGKVVWLEKEVGLQEKKLKVMFEAVKGVVDQKKKGR